MYIGAIDIGGTKTITAVIDETGNILHKEQFPTVEKKCDRHLEQCAQSLLSILEHLHISAADLTGVGVTLPGIVDNKSGLLIHAPYENWSQVPVADLLSKKLGSLKVFCENDVNACAVGEQYFGIGGKYKNYVWMTVSTGVGGAVVNEGKLVRGEDGYAGEFGHLKVEYENPEPCPCGQYGCLEAHGSGTALNREIHKKAEEDEVFSAAFLKEGHSINAAGCASLARGGNKSAIRIFERTGEYLGRGIAYCINILNPQTVIIGGGVSASLDLLLPGIRTVIKSSAFKEMQDIEIIATPLGYEAALLGAAALVLQNRDKYTDTPKCQD